MVMVILIDLLIILPQYILVLPLSTKRLKHILLYALCSHSKMECIVALLCMIIYRMKIIIIIAISFQMLYLWQHFIYLLIIVYTHQYTTNNRQVVLLVVRAFYEIFHKSVN